MGLVGAEIQVLRQAPIDIRTMNRNGSTKTTMDWIMGIHSLLMKGCSEEAQAEAPEHGSISKLSQPLDLESTHTLALRVHGADSAEHPLFNPDAASFVRGVCANLVIRDNLSPKSGNLAPTHVG